MKGRCHLFSHQGLNILVDAPTGAVHLLDDLAVEVFGKWAAGWDRSAAAAELDHLPPKEVEQAWEELEELRRQGVLFGPEPTFPQRPGGGRLKALCLHVAHDCDLRCRYCFAGTGSFGGQRQLMPVNTAFRAVDMLLGQAGQTCEVDFFGGEPLLNLSVVEQTTDYARKRAADLGKHINLTLTTNAFKLTDDIRRRLLALDIDLVLSHDGRPHIHDAMRPTCQGLPSYSQVTDNIVATVAEVGQRHYVRGTFTARNTDFASDVQHWLDLGLWRLSMEPVVAPANSDLALTEKHMPLLRQQYWQLADIILNWPRPVTFFHFLLDWQQYPCGAKRAAGCGAGSEYMAVAPDGGLYPCHQFVGQQQWLLGTVQTGIERRDIQRLFTKTTIADKPDCRQCWARYYCGGGCHANAWWANGDLCKPWQPGCQLLRMRTEAALYVKVRQQLEQHKKGDNDGQKEQTQKTG